ncbi:hypothetical protein KEM56_005064 [Ascosphaera pollenicola]|nr:hypothetical protein KEM56_005064 [Ascosphaera pollenicola]
MAAADVSAFDSYRAYDHVHWYVGNAKQAAAFYTTRMGFRRIAYKGLETGSRAIASHVIRNGDIIFVLTSPLRSLNQLDKIAEEDKALLKEVHAHIEKHGDAVKDVAFTVDSVDGVFAAAAKNGARVVSAPRSVQDEFGEVKLATLQTYGETTHTLVERKGYSGVFLPGYKAVEDTSDPITKYLPEVVLDRVDHCVGNQDWDEMDNACE